MDDQDWVKIILSNKRGEQETPQFEEEKRRFWHQKMNLSGERSSKMMNDYEQKFKVTSIVLRDEILSRFPASEKSWSQIRRYDFPVNPHGITFVMDDLERRARLLK